MNIDREYLCNNGSSNPNQFSVKLGQDIEIHPNSEVGISKIKFNMDSTRNIDSSNDTFALLWGQAGMENAATTGASAFNLLPPQVFKLKHGTWKLQVPFTTHGAADFEAGGPQSAAYGDPNIMTNLIDSLNEQNLYDIWGFAGQYNGNSSFGIWAYLRNHSRGVVGLSQAALCNGSLTIVDSAATGAAPALSTVTDSQDGWAAVSDYYAPMPYSSNIIADTVANPACIQQVTLPVLGANEAVATFGGLILESQESYKQSESYNPDKDWIKGLGENGSDYDIDTDEIRCNMPISWEIDGAGNLIFVQRQINPDGTVGEDLVRVDSGLNYDGTTHLKIQLRPIMVNAPYGGAADALTRLRIECYAVLGGGALAYVTNFVLDRSYFFGQRYKHAIYFTSKNTATGAYGVASYTLTGVDSNRFSYDQTATLGKIDQVATGPVSLGNINWLLITGDLLADEVIPMLPNTTVNYELQRLTAQCNASLIDKNGPDYYFFNGRTNAQTARVGIITNFMDGSVGLCLNIDNLPIDTGLCTPSRGVSQKRIFTLLTGAYETPADVVRDVADEAYNINWKTLHNKSPIIINTLNFRWTDLDGRNVGIIEGRCDILVHIRTNPHKMIVSPPDKKEAIRETLDETEEIFKLAQSVF